MQVYQTQVTDVSVIADIICDVCGKSCLDKEVLNFERAILHADWGYGSNKDGTIWNCDVCESCADKIRTYIESIGGAIQVSYH